MVRAGDQRLDFC